MENRTALVVQVKLKIYVTEMLRFGEFETHHYILGTYSTKEQAKFAGEIEKTWRGGKYDYQVVETSMDEPMDQDKWEHHNACVSD